MLEFSLTGQEVSRRGFVGSDDNGHTTVVSLLGGTLRVVTANGTDDQVLAALGFARY